MSAWVSWHLAEVRRAQGQAAEADRLHRESLATREQYHLEGFSAESQLALATLAMERDPPDAAAAELWTRQALARFVDSNNADSAAWAQALLSQALAQQDRKREAHASFLPALERFTTSQNQLVQLAGLSALASAALKYKPAESDLERLRQKLREHIKLAHDAGMLQGEVELSARLYQLEGASRSGAVQRTAVCALAERAKSSGLARVAALAGAVCDNANVLQM
jgi:hypothetical protein